MLPKKINTFIYVFLLGLIVGAANASHQKLVIDHDGSASDAIAIFMALLNEKYFDGPKVVAITTVHGIVSEPQVFENTQRILSIAERRDIPIFRGSSSALIRGFPTDSYFGYDGLGDNLTSSYEPIKAKPYHAAVALIKLAKKYQDKLVVVTLGPLTNIALAINMNPEFVPRASQLFIAAGSIYANDIKLEFNVKMDIEAYYIVIHNAIADKVTLIPAYPVKYSRNLGKKWRQETFGVLNTEIVRTLNIFERISIAQMRDWSPLEAVAMAIALDSSIIRDLKYTLNGIYLCGNFKGRNTNDFKSKSPKERIIFSVYKQQYAAFLIKIFSADLNHQSGSEHEE